MNRDRRYVPTVSGTISGITQAIHLGHAVASMLPRSEPDYQPPPLENTDPMEGFASGAELDNYRYQTGDVYLGDIHSDHNQQFSAGMPAKDDRHVMMAASNAAGKGRTVIIQNLLRRISGTVSLDLKGELCSITAMRRGKAERAKGTGTSVRQFMEHDVAALDPQGQVKGPARCYRVRYNPMSEIDVRNENAEAEIRKLAAALIVPYQSDNQWISDDTAVILAGVIFAVLVTDKDQAHHNLIYVADLLNNTFSKLIEDLFSHPDLPKEGLAKSAKNIIEEGTEDSKVAGYYKSCLTQNLIWLSDPKMRRHVESSDVSIKKIVQTGGDVYISIDPNYIEEFRGWLRVIVQICMNAKIELGVYQTTPQTLFVLDEFPQLGRFLSIERNASWIRGYNCKMLYVVQYIGQLKTLYKENWEAFTANAGAIIAFALNDAETEEYISNRMGKILAWETSYSVSDGMSGQGLQGGMNSGKTTSQAQRERAVRMPNEVHEQTARDTGRAFVIVGDGKPIIIQRRNYDDISAAVYDSPQFIAQWEQHYRELVS